MVADLPTHNLTDPADLTDETPFQLALRAAESVAERVNDRQAQVRRRFVVGIDPQTPPPMTQLLRGGRGGEVRLKLYLSLLWFAANPPYDVTYAARAWASLLGLPDPGGAGARRINDALRWLGERDYLDVATFPGRPSTAILLSESGSGEPYEIPGAAMRRITGAANSTPNPHAVEANRYFQIPSSFWTSGWLATLSGAAVAMVLVLRAEAPKSRVKGVWFSPRVADERFHLSPQTRSKGLHELTAQGLVTLQKTSLADRDPFEPLRTRNVYFLDDEDFKVPPKQPLGSSARPRNTEKSLYAKRSRQH